MSRKVVEIPVEVWEFSLQDAEHIVALHRETLRLMNENDRLKADIESLVSAGEDLAHAIRSKHGIDFALEEWAKVANNEGGQP